jgi:8-oxo-dGTP pyrophosphatase MutT (NUDIX family)
MRDCVNILFKNAQGKTLWQMRDDNPGIVYPLHWGLWGGAIESDDSDHLAAAVREVFEELELTTTESDFALIHEEIRPSGETAYLVAYKHTLDWGAFKVREGAGAAFFTQPELLKLHMPERLRRYVETLPELFA